ncbi:MAG TPA: hypothetical protein VH081_07930 [Solirubrobacteraceae bacterium]|nr:hypothetical protein [Solirubrobacteraceae bacterium]
MSDAALATPTAAQAIDAIDEPRAMLLPDAAGSRPAPTNAIKEML